MDGVGAGILNLGWEITQGTFKNTHFWVEAPEILF